MFSSYTYIASLKEALHIKFFFQIEPTLNLLGSTSNWWLTNCMKIVKKSWSEKNPSPKTPKTPGNNGRRRKITFIDQCQDNRVKTQKSAKIVFE